MDDRIPAGGPASGNGRALAVFVWLIGVGVVVLGARTWLPPLASEHGAGIDRMIHFTIWATGSMLLLGHVVLGAFIWRSARGLSSRPGWPVLPVIACGSHLMRMTPSTYRAMARSLRSRNLLFTSWL